MLWIARTGARWRHPPDENGKWNSVFRRYRRWSETGVFDALLETLAEMVERDASANLIDRIAVRAHVWPVGLNKGITRPSGLAGCAADRPDRSAAR